MRRPLITIALLLAGCGAQESATFGTVGNELATPTPSAAESYTIEGVFALVDADGIHIERAGPAARAEWCAGTGGYDDIEPGLQVVVRDGEGSTLGTGRLEYDHEAHEATNDLCPLVFTVEVPRSDFYSIEVGRRGELVYDFDEMEEMGWEVVASLGG